MMSIYDSLDVIAWCAVMVASCVFVGLVVVIWRLK